MDDESQNMCSMTILGPKDKKLDYQKPNNEQIKKMVFIVRKQQVETGLLFEAEDIYTCSALILREKSVQFFY